MCNAEHPNFKLVDSTYRSPNRLPQSNRLVSIAIVSH